MANYEVLDKFLEDSSFRTNIAVQHLIKGKEAEWSEIPQNLHEWVKNTLEEMGYQKLYKHQAKAISYILKGTNTVISTGVSSGKSLCYQLPILHSLSFIPETTTLCLYPTKALAQDQFKSFSPLIETFNSISGRKVNLNIYDGDTEQSYRKAIRDKSQIIISNPDMLHLSILPNHSSWTNFFANLKYVIIDEVHVYRGIFGSHFTNVLRRLKRLCSYYGSFPTFILTSATIGNTREFSTSILEQLFMIVDEDSSGQGNRHFLIYNPPLVNVELGIRRSALQETTRLAHFFDKLNVQTLIFTRSRRSVELIVNKLKKNNSNALAGYRSGYLKQERREIEEQFKSGELTSVVSTNAMELGIDIGDLDVIIINGYPGSIASTLQQAGRAGRTGNDSLVVMVANSNLINQYLVQHPEYLFAMTPEHALLDANNPYILLDHLKSTLYELPYDRKEIYYGVSRVSINELLDFLLDKGYAIERDGVVYWNSPYSPAQRTSLRTISSNSFSVMHEGKNIGLIDHNSAYWFAHERAVYIHNGDPFIVTKFDDKLRNIEVMEHDKDYYTEPIIKTDYELMKEIDLYSYIFGKAHYAVLNVHTQVTGFKKLKWDTREILDSEDLDLPQTTLPTKGVILTLSDFYEEFLETKGNSSQANNYGKDWNEIKKQVKQRDHYACQNCGKLESSVSFDVHHIKPFKSFSNSQEANKMDNLVTLCRQCHRNAEIPVKIQSTMSGLAYLIRNLAPLYLMCDSGDIQVNFSNDSMLNDGKGAIIIYDSFKGGIGLSKQLFSSLDEMLHLCYEQVEGCSCSEGCPSCTGPVAENGYGAKESVLELLNEIIGLPLE
ncbi:DEAD/DEAH box helicase [bacterium]|nr:DEAD/DEAH box helicase [bacterium]